MVCSLPGSSIYGIFQARILEWVAISFSRRSSRPRDWTQVSHIVGRCSTIWATREAICCGRTPIIPWSSGPQYFWAGNGSLRFLFLKASQANYSSWFLPPTLMSLGKGGNSQVRLGSPLPQLLQISPSCWWCPTHLMLSERLIFNLGKKELTSWLHSAAKVRGQEILGLLFLFQWKGDYVRNLFTVFFPPVLGF